MAPRNEALWLQSKQAAEMVLGHAPFSPPLSNEIVIRTKAVAINPADNAIQRAGILLTQYPAILGCDAAGIVEEVGSNLASVFMPGDRVVGQTGPLEDYKYSAFQQYVVLKTPALAKIPDEVAFSDAVVLPLGVTTASSCLFPKAMLGLHLPPSQAGDGRILLIWGASSSVGCCAVQLAVTAGYQVFAIASERNHRMLRSLGAVECFDCHADNLVPTVVNALIGKDIVGAFDTISNEASLGALCEILHQSGGRKFISSVMPGAGSSAKLGVVIKTNVEQDLSMNDIDSHIWRECLEPAMRKAKFQYKPDANIVGHRLGSVQEAMNILSQGVSAKKLVVTL